MNIEETLQLIEALKQSGVTKFKSHEHEIVFSGVAEVRSNKDVATAVATPVPVLTEEQAKKNEEATEKLKDLINTVKMSPEELADQIFPAGAGGF
jgi:hypothetical protein